MMQEANICQTHKNKLVISVLQVGSGAFADAKLSTFLLIATEHFAECIHLHEFVQVTGFVD